MKTVKHLLAITLLTGAIQSEARTFEIVFDVNVDQRQIGSLQPFDPLTATNWYYGIEPGEAAPHWSNEDGFVSQTFQLTINFTDNNLFFNQFANSESSIINQGNIYDTQFSNTPFNQEINAANPIANDLDDEYTSSTISASQETPSTYRYSELSINESRSTAYNADEYHRFSKGINLFFSDIYENQVIHPISHLDSIDGMIAFLATVKAENQIFSFDQGWEEGHYYDTSPPPEYVCTNDGAINFCQPIGGSFVDPSYTYFNGVKYTGSATIASITEVSEVPVPAAAWLMGSSLLGLSALARGKK